MQVGVIGIGHVGAGLATSLLDAGHFAAPLEFKNIRLTLRAAVKMPAMTEAVQ